MYVQITRPLLPELKPKKLCQDFYKKLCEIVYGNTNISCQGIMSAALVADHMKMTESEAEIWLRSCVLYGITEKQGGLYVV